MFDIYDDEIDSQAPNLNDIGEEPEYGYPESFVRPALRLMSERRPESVSFEVRMSPSLLVPSGASEWERRALLHDPLRIETKWDAVKARDGMGRAIIAAIDSRAVGKNGVADVMREVCLHLQTESGYSVLCVGNAMTNAEKPAQVYITRRLQPAPSRGVN